MSFLRKIEEKWQQRWEEAKIFEADPDEKRSKFFITFPYSYMNGPLHVGHAFTASRVDAFARYKRMQGYNVLFPWAWHWTGQPIAGASQRVAKGDKEFIRILKEVDGVPEDEITKFAEPINMATYYTNEGRVAVRKAGFSVDWRREFNTLMPTYQKFIEWQYETLRELGYVSKGTHPVVWCTRDESPTGDHDRQVGEGVTPEEYTLIKFKLNDHTYLPAATFRPETIYGVTNIWLNPDASYVEASINSERWVISQRAAGKLKEQNRTVKIERHFKGKELIGKTFENPMTKGKLLILPGSFVNPDQATGIVYSVPAHAPYDWLALKDLQENPKFLRDFGIDPESVRTIRPISLIKVEGYGEFPAAEIVKQMNIQDQNDPKADEATKQLYKKEFHSGVLNENCREYSGKMVRNVKDQLIREFKTREIADSMYDLPEPVVCRCLTPCIVKVLQDQWFLNYSDYEWKEKTRKALANMQIYPETATSWFLAVIDWLKEWACARRTGFGTPLPWGDGWVIETLSDSTVYMAFYTLSKHIKKFDIKPEMLTKKVFDYLFFGNGNLSDVAADSGLNIELLGDMRTEFMYWYPVDLRVSAKELVPNHLTFFIFHHVALFKPKQWPKAIGVNGMLMIEGKQMHKSKGNFVTIKNAIDRFGADAMRCALLMAAEGMDDPDWRSSNAEDMQQKLEAFHGFALSLISSASNTKRGQMEKWLLSKLQKRIADVTDSIENMKTRTALAIALFEVWNDFRWYLQRKEKPQLETVREALSIWIRLLTPFVPHISEEIWSELGKKGFVSLASWPIVDLKCVDLQTEEKDNLVVNMIEDTQDILKATKISPKRVYFYTAAPWKWRVFEKVLQRSKEGELTMSKLMKEFAADAQLKPHVREIAKFAAQIIKDVNRMPPERKEALLTIGQMNEKDIIKDAYDFLRQKLGASIEVFNEEDVGRVDSKRRASLSAPCRPAIYIE